MRFPARAGDYTRGSYRGFDDEQLRDRVELSDGGVYDNLGTEPAIKTCRLILVSDAGAPFAFIAGQHVLRRLLRYVGVVGNQAVALRKRLFYRGLLAGEYQGAYWNLDQRHDAGAAGYSLGLGAELMGRIRTDLDRFTAAEFAILVNHGYFSCEDGMHARPGLVGAAAPAADWPYPEWSTEREVRRILHGSHRRFWHRRWWTK
jgi:NTE family protein